MSAILYSCFRGEWVYVGVSWIIDGSFLYEKMGSMKHGGDDNLQELRD